MLFESAVICEYLDEVEQPRLHPSDALMRARHRAWVEFASATLNTIGAFYNAPDPAALERQRRALSEKFEALEGQLGRHSGPYFGGVDFSLVDAAFAPVFRYFEVFDTIADFRCFERAPRVAAWRAQLARRPSVRDAVSHSYDNALRTFLVGRNSALSALMAGADSAPARLD